MAAARGAGGVEAVRRGMGEIPFPAIRFAGGVLGKTGKNSDSP